VVVVVVVVRIFFHLFLVPFMFSMGSYYVSYVPNVFPKDVPNSTSLFHLGGGEDFFSFFPLFPSCSQWVLTMFPTFPMCSPRMFPIAPHFFTWVVRIFFHFFPCSLHVLNEFSLCFLRSQCVPQGCSQ